MLKEVANFLTANGTQKELAGPYLGNALREIANDLAALRRTVDSVSKSVTALGGGGVAIKVHKQTLTAASTEINPGSPQKEGDVLVVQLTVDAVGGRQVTWAAAAFHATPVQFDNGANKKTVWTFAAINDGGLKWCMLSRQTRP